MSKEITEDEARALILQGSAGYWSVHANPPIEHDEQIVVCTQKRFFLCNRDEVKIDFVTPVGVLNGRQKGAFGVNIEQTLDIFPMIYEELQKHGYKS